MIGALRTILTAKLLPAFLLPLYLLIGMTTEAFGAAWVGAVKLVERKTTKKTTNVFLIISG